MSIPAPPVLGFSFTSFSTNNPTSQQPGGSLDAEFNRTNGAVSQLINAVQVSVNADGTLNSAQVGAAYTAFIAGGGGSGSNTDIAEANSQLYAELAQAWAEYTLGPIPADTLITDGITGQHYSAAWWANQAAVNVAIQDQKLQNALAAGQLNQNAPGLPGAPITSLVNLTLIGGALTALPPGGSNVVTSVAGRSGAVTLAPADIIGLQAAVVSYAPVTTVAGRTGAITLTTADVSGAATVSAMTTADTAEATARAAADSAEATARAAADSAETAARTTAVTNEATARANAITAEATARAAADAANTGRNLFHNGAFTIQQRGAGPWTTSLAYMADRWETALILDVTSFSIVTLADADRTAIGDEAARYALQSVFSGNVGATAFTQDFHKIEDVRRLAGKTVTVSFFAKAASGTPKFGVNLAQVFGTGGSPSAGVAVPGQSVTLSTSWQRYSLTFAIPSIAGKTLGSNGDDFTQVDFWYSAGANNNSSSGTVGVQTNTIQTTQRQIEINPTATPYEHRDPQTELALCQRFYQSFIFQIVGYAPAPGSIASGSLLPVPMRATPSVVISLPTYSNASGAATYGVTPSFFAMSASVTALGTASANAIVALSADL